MSVPKPHFKLARVYSDRTQEAEIVPVTALPWDIRMDRRGLLGAGLSAAATLLFLRGQGHAAGPKKTQRKNPNAETAILKAHSSSVNALSVTPDGKILISGAEDKTIKLWSLPKGRFIKTLEQHTYGVNALAVTPDGKIFISGAGDETLKLWSLPKGQLLKTLKGHGGSVTTLAVSPDGRILASGSKDKTVKLWSLPKGQLLKTVEGVEKGVRTIVITPDGKILAAGFYNKQIKLWSLPEGQFLTTLQGHEADVTALIIGSGENTLISGSDDQSIRIWSLPEGLHSTTLHTNPHRVKALAVSPNGKTLVSGEDDNGIRLWSLPEGQLSATLQKHSRSVEAVAITPNGKTLISGDSDGTILLWDLERQSFLSFLFDPHENESDAISYNVYNRVTGQTLTYTLPCGSPIPPGAVCTCNCVPGTYQVPTPTIPSFGGGTYCTCNKVCVCIPVCQGHKVLHEDPVVQVMAEELLLLMGEHQFNYMAWAAANADTALKVRIGEIVEAIRAGVIPDPRRWPTVEECLIRLDSSDEVVAIMAAQLLYYKRLRQGIQMDHAVQQRVFQLLQDAGMRPWSTRQENAFFDFAEE